MDPYKIKIGGVVADPYRIAIEYGLDPILGQALKKILRCGRKHKSAEEDAKEVITTMERWLEIQRERAHEDAVRQFPHPNPDYVDAEDDTVHVDLSKLSNDELIAAGFPEDGIVREAIKQAGIKTNMEKILDERAGETNWP